MNNGGGGGGEDKTRRETSTAGLCQFFLEVECGIGLCYQNTSSEFVLIHKDPAGRSCTTDRDRRQRGGALGAAPLSALNYLSTLALPTFRRGRNSKTRTKVNDHHHGSVLGERERRTKGEREREEWGVRPLRLSTTH